MDENQTPAERIEKLKKAKEEKPFLELKKAQNDKSATDEKPVSVEYDPEKKQYTIKSQDGHSAVIKQEQLESLKMNRREDQARRSAFSSDPQVIDQYFDKENILQTGALAGYYALGQNEVHMNLSQVDQNELEAYLKESSGLDTLTPNSVIEAYNNGQINASDAYVYLCSKELPEDTNSEKYKQVYVHEMTHLYDDKRGAFDQVNLSAGYQTKINMCTEINANMSQVARLYDYYQEHGSFKDYPDGVSFHCINPNDDPSRPEACGDYFKEIQQYISEHAGEKDCKQNLAKMVYEGWLAANNHEGSPYYQQSMNMKKLATANSKEAGAFVDNTANLNEYHKRTDVMFKNSALGDVRAVVNPDFKLGASLEIETAPVRADNQTDEFLQKATEGSRTVFGATQKVRNLLNKVKRADEDGVRTPKEQEKIDKALIRVLKDKSGRPSGEENPPKPVAQTTLTPQMQRQMQNQGGGR